MCLVLAFCFCFVCFLFQDVPMLFVFCFQTQENMYSLLASCFLLVLLVCFFLGILLVCVFWLPSRNFSPKSEIPNKNKNKKCRKKDLLTGVLTNSAFLFFGVSSKLAVFAESTIQIVVSAPKTSKKYPKLQNKLC